MKPAILYISYDGMLEPLGQSQVLAYLERLSGDYAIRLISFEKKGDWSNGDRRRAVQARIAAAGIAWIPLRYHKAPTAPATAFDIGVGTIVALYQTLRYHIPVIHCRSYVPASMALVVKRLTRARFLLDMRGFWADERLDAGLWPRGGRLYRLVKWLEKHFLRTADHVVTLTDASAAKLRRLPYLQGREVPITIVPTCADLNRFRQQGTNDGAGLTFGFIGAASTWSLFDQILRFYTLLREREPAARLLIVNRNEHPFICQRLAEMRIDPDQVDLVAAEHEDMPELISRMTVGAALRMPTYSQIACAPTKLAEYLGCGVPCLTNRGIGDVEQIVQGSRVGVVLRDFSESTMRAGVDELIALIAEPDLRARCVETAHRLFSLEKGVTAYREIYRQLICKAASPSAI